MSRHRRLDSELVRRKLARSRQQASELIQAGQVTIHGIPATKPSTAVTSETVLQVISQHSRNWVSRGAYKLLGALDDFCLDVTNRYCLDAGASTGGFTEVLLDRGAQKVFAVDVGYGQLAWPLRTDPRVVVIERTNIRYMDPQQLAKKVDLIVADLSFISLTKVLPTLIACAHDDADILPMVKPQFEVGKDLIGPKGVVTDPYLRAQAIQNVAQYADQLHWSTVGISTSQLPGPAGNIEYFLHLRHNATTRLTDQDFSAISDHVLTGNQYG